MAPATSLLADSPQTTQVLLKNLSLSDHHTTIPRSINHLSRDEALNKDSNRDALSATVIVFMLTHAPETPEEPLKGIFMHTERIAKSCRMDPSKFVNAVCEILGFAGVVVQDKMQKVFERRDTFWEAMLEAQKTFTEQMYDPRLLDSNDMYRHFDRPYDECDSGVLSTYHLTILREMVYYNRTIELSQARGKRGPPAGELKEDLSSWFIQELQQEKELSRPRYLSWYNMPASEKIAKLVQMREFIDRLIELREAEENAPRQALYEGGHDALAPISGPISEIWQVWKTSWRQSMRSGRLTSTTKRKTEPKADEPAIQPALDSPAAGATKHWDRVMHPKFLARQT